MLSKRHDRETKEFENFVAQLYVGPNEAPVELMLELSTSEMFVKTDECINCTGRGQYDTFSEDNLPVIPATQVSYEFGFGTKLDGEKVETKVCLSKGSACVQNTQFFRVTE